MTKHKVGRWSKREHNIFKKYYIIYGKNWSKIDSIIKTRNKSQIRSHAQKYFKSKEYSIALFLANINKDG